MSLKKAGLTFNGCTHYEEYLQEQFVDLRFFELSMGTSADFETAIAEGATL
jgi:uncharacterized pyridoxal phosphate-containing UPF0001 family protein